MREMKQVEQDYSGLVMKAGQLSYQIEILTKDLSLVHEQMKDLNFEAAAINNTAKKEAETKASEPSAPKLEGLSS